MYRYFRPYARANLTSIVVTAHSLHLHIGVALRQFISYTLAFRLCEIFGTIIKLNLKHT